MTAMPHSRDDVRQFKLAHRDASRALARLTAWQNAHPGTVDYRATDAIRALTTARTALQQLRDGTHSPRWLGALEKLRERLADESGEPGDHGAGEEDAGDTPATSTTAPAAHVRTTDRNAPPPHQPPTTKGPPHEQPHRDRAPPDRRYRPRPG
jgi:hypothetical protein